MIIIREHINNHTSPLSNANYSLASVAFASINHHFPDLESQSSHVNQPDKHCNRTAQPDLLAAAIAPRAPRPTEIYCCLSVSSIFILQASAWAGIVGHVCIPTQTLRSILGGPTSGSHIIQYTAIPSSSHPSLRLQSSQRKTCSEQIDRKFGC